MMNTSKLVKTFKTVADREEFLATVEADASPTKDNKRKAFEDAGPIVVDLIEKVDLNEEKVAQEPRKKKAFSRGPYKPNVVVDFNEMEVKYRKPSAKVVVWQLARAALGLEGHALSPDVAKELVSNVEKEMKSLEERRMFQGNPMPEFEDGTRFVFKSALVNALLVSKSAQFGHPGLSNLKMASRHALEVLLTNAVNSIERVHNGNLKGLRTARSLDKSGRLEKYYLYFEDKYVDE